MTIMEVALADIVCKDYLQPRAEMLPDIVSEYAEAMEAGDKFPPITLYEVDGELLLVSGWTRLAATRKTGRETIRAEVRQGTLDEAKAEAWGANHDHGSRRTNADKRHAATLAFRDPEWKTRSDGAIAEALRVSQKFIRKMRSEVIDPPQEQVCTVLTSTGKPGRLGKDGKTYPVKNAPADESAESDTEPGGIALHEPDDDPAICEEALALLATIKPAPAHSTIMALAEYTEESQLALVQSVVDGIQSLPQAIERGEVPEPSAEQKIKIVNRAIDAFCRLMVKTFDDNLPDDAWLAQYGRKNTARQKVVDACATLRTAKCHKPCPACDAIGCHSCLETGRVPKADYMQMKGA